jgi:hypothetical protein
VIYKLKGNLDDIIRNGDGITIEGMFTVKFEVNSAHQRESWKLTTKNAPGLRIVVTFRNDEYYADAARQIRSILQSGGPITVAGRLNNSNYPSEALNPPTLSVYYIACRGKEIEIDQNKIPTITKQMSNI